MTTLLVIVYIVCAVGFYTPSRENPWAKLAYFVVFPLPTVFFPLILAFCQGMGDFVGNPATQQVGAVIWQIILWFLGVLLVMMIFG